LEGSRAGGGEGAEAEVHQRAVFLRQQRGRVVNINLDHGGAVGGHRVLQRVEVVKSEPDFVQLRKEAAPADARGGRRRHRERELEPEAHRDAGDAPELAKRAETCLR
jgi:hypothetical protein